VRPTAVEPVKLSLRSRGSASSAAETSAGRVVVTTFTTPGGSPTSTSSSANSSDVSGVSSVGFRTTVHPAASAGASLRVAMASAKFHGVTR
jgi:membrane-bound ClpP family serine protease